MSDRRLPLWKVTMHCRGQEGDYPPLADKESRRVVLGVRKTLVIRVLGDLAFSAALELPATSALTAVVEGVVLINWEIAQEMPDWPVVEICAEPVDQGCAATQAYGATGCT